MIPEAEMLSLLDDLDARMFMMKQSMDATAPGHFGPRVFALENRMIYRPRSYGQQPVPEDNREKAAESSQAENGGKQA